MWPFKKKEVKKVLDKPLKIAEYRKEKHDIGRTLIKCTFLDGRKFSFWCYGMFHQYVDLKWSQNIPEHTVSPITIEKSLLRAQKTIRTDLPRSLFTLVDDEKNPKKSVIGQVIASEILRSEPYIEEFDVAYLVENKDEKK